MILYCDTVRNFINSAEGANPIIGQMLLNKFKTNNLSGGGNSEYNSWIHSLPKVAEALKDESKIVVGAIVVHSKFGKGEIISIDKTNKYLSVKFEAGEKKFANPSAFEMGFLKILD